MSTILHKYSNGNYDVELYNDGTKIRRTKADSFVSAFPENIDVKITNYCDAGCSFCHEDSTKQGKHGNLELEFFNTLKAGTELAIGGGNPLSHPQLIPFLTRMKNQGVICNLTINQIHFENSQPLIQELVKNDLVKGIGVSLMRYKDSLIELTSHYENIVFHVINGIVRLEELRKMYQKNLKILILGYKYLRRGMDFYSEKIELNKKEIYDNIHEIIRNFQVVSFDNLGIEQLNVKRLMLNHEWEKFFMGEDGMFTMYIDCIKEEFALSSTKLQREPITKNIVDMFNVVKTKLKEGQ